MQSFPFARELVLIGGGHSHVIFLRMLGMKPIPGLRVTLVSPEVLTPYSGMLPGLVAGHYQMEEAFIDLAPLCRFAGADFIKAAATGLDPNQQSVQMPGRPPLRYDVLSIDIGSTPNLAGLSGNDVLAVKPISTFLDRWSRFEERFSGGDMKNLAFVGAGAGGVELCLAVHHRLSRSFPGQTANFHLITKQEQILAEFPVGVRSRFEQVFRERQIQIHLGFDAVGCGDGSLISSSNEQIDVDQAFWVTQAGVQPWPAESGLKTDGAGFIEVDDKLRSLSHPNVFAVGDCATMVNHPRPKAGVFAVRQGKPLFHNVRATVLGKPLKSFRPQEVFLSLVSTGDQQAVAARIGGSERFTAAGPWVWRWKDWIDRRFMRRFSKLPDMQVKPPNRLLAEFDDQMHCGGCGAKVSADILTEVLDDILPGGAPGDDAAEIVVPRGMRLLQTVDHLRSFVDDPYIQARIAVVHALSDIYACGGQGLSAMAMLTLPFAKPDVTRSLLTQVLRGVYDQLCAENTELIGGHTSEGPELSIGLSVNGVVRRGDNWTKQGAQNGDLMILTKSIGTGVLLAADMQSRAKGEWISAAVSNMLLSNKQAVNVFSDFGVSACTDVTGFGLAGHCQEMLRESVGIELEVSALPVLEGAAELLASGIRSTLHESNRLASVLVANDDCAEVLFDPQTSGGLLATVPVSGAANCLAALKDAGYPDAAVIGSVNTSGLLTLK